ncbi:MAG: histidine phosphatase family protein [Burkholderiaceae bacterium]
MGGTTVTPTRENPLSLFLVRHGQTDWSLSGQHTGSTDIPLTMAGEDEARALAPWLIHIHFDHVLTSQLQRARRTCALVGLGRQADIEPDLAEWDYGDYEGLRSSDIRQRRPDWNVFRDGCPHGEMPAQVSDRADRLIARLCTMSGNVALFSHGEFGMALAARWIGLALLDAQHFLIGTASLGVLGYNPAHPEVRVIALWNATPTLFTSKA